MFDKKVDVDRHVESCLKKINNERERNLRSFAFAKLYFNIGEAELARRYVSSYLGVKPNSAEAHQLLGRILEKLGRRDTALEEYRISLDLDSKQSGLILKVCELLAEGDVLMEPSKARYWCEQAQLLDPQNQAVFNLKERIISNESNNPDDIRKLFLSELEHRPTDVSLRVRLLNHLLQNNQINEAYRHVVEIEQRNLSIFTHHFAWYETLTKVLVRYKNENLKSDALKWDFWMFIINIFDKLTMLSMDENAGTIKPLSECINNVFNLDQMLMTAFEKISKSCLEKQYSQEFFIHYRAQFCFHICTLLFKQAKKDQLTYKESINFALPLLLISYHSQPPDLQSVWLDHTTEHIREQIQRWHREASYRCSQSGHILLSVIKGRRSNFADRVTQLCSGSWREKTFKNIFITRDQQLKIKSSYFVNSFSEDVTIKLPDATELFRYDETAQLVYPDSLHHIIWIGLNNQSAKFHCTVFDGLQYSVKNLSICAAETLNVLDIQAFIYCSVFCAQSQIEDSKHFIYFNQDKPNVLPASITEPLGTMNQTKWFVSVYKMFRNELGSDMSDIRVTLIKGIEIVRCIGSHGLDVKLLVLLANTFAQKAKLLTKQCEIEQTEARAELYWKSALPLLEKLRNNQAITYPVKKWFEYRGKEMTPTEINMNIEDGKLFSAVQLMKKKSHEKALQMLESLRSPYASFYQAQTYKLLADEQMSHNKENVTSEMRSQHIILLSRARDCLYLTLDRLREPSVDRKHPLNAQLSTEIEKIERLLSRIDPDICGNRNDCDGMSDENVSSVGSVGDQANISSAYMTHTSFHNGNLTPRNDNTANATYFHMDTALNSSRRAEARPSPERLDAQLRQMAASKDAAIAHILEQNKLMVDSHRSLVDELRNFKDAVTNLTSSVDELKGIKKSVEELKEAVDDLQNLKEAVEQVYEIKKDLAELKKDTTKLKNNQINDEDLYALEDEYGVDYNIGANAAGFNSAAFYSNFPQRMQGANTLAYGAPGLYGMYPMYPYSGLNLGQPGTLPFPEGQIPDYRSMGSIAQGLSQTGLTQSQVTLAQQGLPNMFTKFDNNVVPQFPVTQSQMLPQRPVVSQSAMPTYVVPNQIAPTSLSNLATINSINNPVSSAACSALPVNVVITASDPLPTTSAAQPILSVTIPPQHLKGNQNKKQPHNYQIPLPVTTQPSFSAVNASITSIPIPVSTQNLLSNVAPPVFSSLSVQSPVQSSKGQFGAQMDKSLNLNLNVSQTSNDSHKSNHNGSNILETSASEEHDPCPDFKPIIPLPDEVNVTTGEENEEVLFCERAKLYRYVDKEWRERGTGNIKLLYSKEAGKVRILMRRELVHKICANHFLTPDMILTPMQNTDRAYIWAANDFADENMVLEKLCVRFKNVEIGSRFYESFNHAKQLLSKILEKTEKITRSKEIETYSKNKSSGNILQEHLKSKEVIVLTPKIVAEPSKDTHSVTSLGGFMFTSTPTFKPKTSMAVEAVEKPQNISSTKPSPFASFTFDPKTSDTGMFADKVNFEFKPVQKQSTETSLKETASAKPVGKVLTLSDNPNDDDFIPTAEFKPVIPLPELIEVKTGEENSVVLYEVKAKLLRFDSDTKEWKERGVGIIKILKEKTIRLVMRREHIHKVCCNHQLLKSMVFTNMPKNNRVLNWCAQDYSEGVLKTEMFAIRFRTPELCEEFLKSIHAAQSMLDSSNGVMSDSNITPFKAIQTWDEKYLTKDSTWECSDCYVRNDNKHEKCLSCGSNKNGNFTSDHAQSPQKFKPSVSPQTLPSWGEKFKQKIGTWECKTCYVHNDGKKNYCEACDTPKNDTIPIKDVTIDKNASGDQFSFGITPNFNTPVSNAGTTNFFFGQQKTASSAASGWDNTLFKPKTNSWTCKSCYVSNENSTQKCVACNSSKDGAIPEEKDKFSFGSGTPNTSIAVSSSNTSATFSFGQSATITSIATGWGDKFKPKEDSWNCKACYVNNKNESLSCVACNTLKEGVEKEVVVPATVTTTFSFGIKPIVTDVSDWGDKFKPKEGSWDCKMCYVHNHSQATSCLACNTSKEGVEKNAVSSTTVTSSTFSFGIKPDVTEVSNWGDKFKPKEGSWDCKLCYVNNKSDALYCIACDNPKDDTIPKKSQGIDLTSGSESKFIFGKANTATETIFGAKTSTAVGFSFGLPQTKAPTTGFTFGIPVLAYQDSVVEQPNQVQPPPLDLASKTFNFSMNISVPSKKTETLDPPKKEEFVFGSPHKYDFEFKPRSPRKQSFGDGEDSDGSVTEDDEDHIYFKPVIPLPEKVDVRTGEEDEEVLYCHRAKLFRFTGGEWKERGIGDIKILKNTLTEKLRVVMRREQVLKICLNHALTNDIEYKPKDDRTWLFSSADYSEGEISYNQFCIRFKNVETAKQFMDAVEKARNKTNVIVETPKIAEKTDEDDLIVVYELKVTPEEEKKALDLQLPKNFYAYLQKPPCKGCIGCNPDDFVFETVKSKPKTKLENTDTDPVLKTNETSIKSTSSTTTINTSTSSTTSVASKNIKPALSNSPLFTSVSSSNITNSTVAAPLITSTITTHSPVTFSFNSQLISAANSISTEINPVNTQSHKSPIAPPKLSSTSTGSIFSFPKENKPSTNMFAGTANIFGGTPKSSEQKNLFQTNIFGNSTQPTQEKTQESFKSFSFSKSEDNQNSATSTFEGQSMLSNPDNSGPTQKTAFDGFTFDLKSKSDEKLFDNNRPVFGNSFGQAFNTSTQKNPKPTAPILKCDSSLNFAALASETSTFIKKDDSKTFMFEGAGTPVFGSLKTDTVSANTSEVKDEETDTHAETGDDYDPHYEPIVPLPDTIVVKTGEEEEKVLFIERAKLYRFTTESGTAEWKERGVGQIKVLHHPVNGTYRLLMRREQVHKLVLNQLITADLDLQPMQTSDRAWLWGGYNYLEDGANLEKLAVRFKNPELAQQFYKAIQSVVNDIQINQSKTDDAEQEDIEGSANEEYGSDESDENRTTMFSKRCTLSMKEGSDWKVLGMGVLKIYYDSDLYGGRIVMYDDNKMQLSNTIIAINTSMKIKDTTCTWRAMEWSLDPAVPRILKARFSSAAAAEEMYYNFEESMQYAQQCEIVDTLPEENF